MTKHSMLTSEMGYLVSKAKEVFEAPAGAPIGFLCQTYSQYLALTFCTPLPEECVNSHFESLEEMREIAVNCILLAAAMLDEID